MLMPTTAKSGLGQRMLRWRRDLQELVGAKSTPSELALWCSRPSAFLVSSVSIGFQAPSVALKLARPA
mgnify:CR=1 FL=1